MGGLPLIITLTWACGRWIASLTVNAKLREFLMSTLSLRMKDENDKHEKIEAVSKRDMGVLLLSLLAKEKAGLELRKLGLKTTEDMGE